MDGAVGVNVETVTSTLTGAAAARALRMPTPVTRVARVRRHLGLRARDGVILRTDHYVPALDSAPTVLMRTPYGRGGVTALGARVFAAQGFHVVVQSCRGTGGSTGTFEPMRYERDDGLDTVDWLRRQPWFTGRLGTFGPSYVGYTQWAISDVPELEAMATMITASQFRDPTYAGESFSLFTTLAWANILHTQAGPWWENALELLRGQPRLHAAFGELPLTEADRAATGAEVAFFRRWLSLAGARGTSPEFDEYWGELGHEHRLPEVKAPVLMVGGWYDIFLPWQLADHAALREAGVATQLVIGPWTHGSTGLLFESLRTSAIWLRRHLTSFAAPPAPPVRVFVGSANGSGSWRGYDDWPPPFSAQTWHLQPAGRLATPAPPESTPDSFRYDPLDPTPSVGGPLLVSQLSGPRDNTALEARPDVLVYSSDRLASDVEIIGPVHVTARVRATSPHFDVFARLCDAGPDGRSINICDGLVRVVPGRFPTAEDGVIQVDVALWPTAYRFRAGHRIRLQLSGGAHPRYVRSTGTPDPLATTLQPVTIEVHHSPAHASTLTLPLATVS